jgi:hypothetical protein
VNDLYHAALQVQEFRQARNWRHCFIGGLALLRWGEPRQTKVADLVLLTQFQNEEDFVTKLFAHFSSRVENPVEFAMQNRVVLLTTEARIPIDISLGGLPFEEHMIDRASAFEYLHGVDLVTASKEDLVVLKAFAGRAKDWVDLEGILICQGSDLDWKLILMELAPLCELKESPETVDRLIELRDSLAAE